jgi:hypothetical protein
MGRLSSDLIANYSHQKKIGDAAPQRKGILEYV